MSKSFEQRSRLLSLVESKQRGFGAKNPNQQGMSSVLIERRNPARRMRKNAVTRKNCFSEEMSPRRKMIERQRDDLAKKRKIFRAHDPPPKRKSLRNASEGGLGEEATSNLPLFSQTDLQLFVAA
jgi:hypothetical protein